MKMRKLTLLIFIATLFLVSSCGTMKVTNSGKKTAPVTSIALYSTMIGRVVQPIFPLIDAAAFNEKTNSIADQIMDMQKKNVDTCRKIIANSLRKNFNCEVISDSLLHSRPEFAEIKSRFNYPNSLRIENNHYPQIISSTDDVNSFQFNNGKVVQYFGEPENYKSTLAEICTQLNTDLIAISFSHLSVTGAGMFGAYGFLRLDTYIYLFDKEGDLVSSGHTWSKPANISGREVEQYKTQLDNLSLIIEPLMIKVASNYKTN